MKVGELRRVWDDDAMRVGADHEILVDVHLSNDSVISCAVTGFRDSVVDGPATGEDTFTLYAAPLQPDD